MRDAFIGELTALAETDESVFLVIGDLGFSVVEEFVERFPERFLNAGVAEQTMIGAAAGLAASGFTVFCYSIGNFPTMRCLEQIRNDVSYHNRAVTVVSVGGGVAYGNLGYTHHAIEDIAVMRALPRLRIMSPADPAEARALTRYAVENPGPGYLRLGKNGEPTLRTSAVTDAARPAVLREGSDVSLLATGSIAGNGLAAAELLAAEGIEVQVVSVPVIKPFPGEVFELVTGSRAVVTLEEHSRVGGFGSAVLEAAADASLRIPISVVGLDEVVAGAFIGSQSFLREKGGISTHAVADGIRSALALA